MLTRLLSSSEMSLIKERHQLICQLYDNKMVLVRRKVIAETPIAQLLRSSATRVSSGGFQSIPYLTLSAALGENGKFTHIPFRGEHLALVALAQGEVEASVVTYASYLLARQTFELQAVTLLSNTPWDGAVDIPLLANAGFPVKFASSPAVVAVQAGTRPELVALLSSECEKFVVEEPSRSRLVSLGIDPVFRSGVDAMKAIQAGSLWLVPGAGAGSP
jgi:tripartite-type tricarboxylate transporter receptor subunit TctC